MGIASISIVARDTGNFIKVTQGVLRMNRMLSTAELQELSVMTRRDKLLRWAKLVRETQKLPLTLYSNLEYKSQEALNITRVRNSWTAFDLAAADPIFRAAGLPNYNTSIGDCQRFFELTQSQLHEFSCDCGGMINNRIMAERIESLA